MCLWSAQCTQVQKILVSFFPWREVCSYPTRIPALEKETYRTVLQNCRDTITIPAQPPWFFNSKPAEIPLAVFIKVRQDQVFIIRHFPWMCMKAVWKCLSCLSVGSAATDVEFLGCFFSGAQVYLKVVKLQTRASKGALSWGWAGLGVWREWRA